MIQRDIFELMQRVTDQDTQMRLLTTSSDSADQTVDRQTAELNHLKQYVNVLQEKVDKLMGLTGELSDKFAAQMDRFSPNHNTKR